MNSISVLVFVRLELHVLFRGQSLKTNEVNVDILGDAGGDKGALFVRQPQPEEQTLDRRYRVWNASVVMETFLL